MQRAASIERKIVLKEQRNLIRQQLSTDNMLSKMKVNSTRERRSSGPLKVLQSHTEFIRSETSVTKRSSSDKEKHSDVFSITSHQSMTHSVVSEISEVEASTKDLPSREQQKHIKRTLLMREEALKKRRKAAEELLQWHKKLLEEEKRIAVLESTASAIISQKPSSSKSQEKFNFKGKQLNQLWLNLTGNEGKKFTDDKIYPMSQLDLEHFCKSARGYSLRTKSLFKKTSDNLSESENIPTQPTTEREYLSDFEKESVPEVDVVDQSIDILINNFNQIQDDISTLNIIHSRKSDESLAEDTGSNKFDKTDSEAGTSVIETNRTRSVTSPKKLLTASVEAVEENVPSLEKSRESTSEKITSLEKDTEMIPSLEELNLDEDSSRSVLEETSKLKPSSILSEQLKTDLSKHSANEKEQVTTKSDMTKLSSAPDEHLTRSVELMNLANKEAVEQQISIVAKDEDVSDIDVPLGADSKETLNESQEILELLGESEVKTVPKDSSAKVQLKDSVTESEEILSKLSQMINETEDTNDQVVKSVEISEISIRAVEDLGPGNEEVMSHSSEVKSVIDEDQSISQISTSKSEENIKSQLSTSATEENKEIKSSVKSNDSEHEEDSAESKVSRLSDVIVSKTQEDNIKSQSSASAENVISVTEENEEITSSKVEENIIESKANRSFEDIASKTAGDNTEISSALVRSKSEDKSDHQLKETVEFKKPSIEEYISKTKSTISSDQSRAASDLNSQTEDDTKLTGSPIQSNSSLSKSIEDGLSQSLKKLIEISKSDIPVVEDSGSLSKVSANDVLQDISALEDFIKSELERTESEVSGMERPKDEERELERAKSEASELERAELEASEQEHAEAQTNEMESNENKINVFERTESVVSEVEPARSEEKIDLGLAEIEASDLEGAKSEVSDLEHAKTEVSDLKDAENDPIDLEPAKSEMSALERAKTVSVEEIVNGTFENLVDEVEDNDYKSLDDAIGDESDDSKVALSDKSNESFIVNDISDELSQNQEDPIEESEKLSKELEAKEVTEKSDKDCSITEDFEEETSSKSSRVISNLSYGLIGKARSESDSSVATSKEEVCYEEKEHDSLSSVTGGSSSDLSELVVLAKDQKAMKNKKNIQDLSVKSKSESDGESSSPRMNVKKRVSEILADASLSRRDKSHRLQDLYVTTYDLISPANSPERAPSSPVEENKLVTSIFVSEAEEILRKQLAVEEEMKAITEQLQKEQLPVMYIREIPNKPPPPYTPPTSLTQPSVPTIIPTAEEIEEITMYSAKILHKAYLSKNLVNVNISNNTLSLISKNISKDCYKFVFDLCKDIARKHYR
uniref:Myosin-2 heavy chain-like isoform X1 n=2 Tax=Diabrotica virgifera virgifera TaxID=50390 RepID=A0A6P7GUT8_DIAVI